MSPDVLFQLIGPIGILSVVAAVTAVGWWRTETIPDLEFAANRFITDFPEHRSKRGVVSNDRLVALLEVTKGPDAGIGFVVVAGDKWATRLLSPTNSHIERCSTGLKLTINDFTMPTTLIRLEADAADHWLTSFKQLSEVPYGSTA